MDALVRANIFLRTTQRILLKVAEFKALTFEELFQNVKRFRGKSISHPMRDSG